VSDVTEAEANDMSVIELFQRVILGNEKIEEDD
jgi:hypothetical protein